MGSERRGRAVHGRVEVNPSGEEPTDGPKQKLKSFEIRKRVFEAWENRMRELYSIAARIDVLSDGRFKRLRGQPTKDGDGSTLPASASHNSSLTGTSSLQPHAGLWEPYDGRLSRTVLSLNPPTGLWDRRLGPGGRWAGACVRAGAFWGVQDWGAGLVRVGGGWGSAALRRALWAAQR